MALSWGALRLVRSWQLTFYKYILLRVLLLQHFYEEKLKWLVSWNLHTACVENWKSWETYEDWKVDQMTVIWSYDIDGYNISGCLCKFLSKFDVLFCAIIRFSNYVGSSEIIFKLSQRAVLREKSVDLNQTEPMFLPVKRRFRSSNFQLSITRSVFYS